MYAKVLWLFKILKIKLDLAIFLLFKGENTFEPIYLPQVLKYEGVNERLQY